MNTDFYQLLLYDPLYNSALGSEAILNGSTTLTVVDRTEGVGITDARTQIETVRPVCFVRARELATRGIAVADLPEALISFNGNIWRVKAYRVIPSPYGESDGQVMLILLSEG